MAKAKQRWAVREADPNSEWYWFFIGKKPRKPKGGWPGPNDHTRNRRGPMRSHWFEAFFPKRYHLEPGGGPVEIEFKHEA